MKKYQSFLSENFQFLEVKFSIYLNRRVLVMKLSVKSQWLEGQPSAEECTTHHPTLCLEKLVNNYRTIRKTNLYLLNKMWFILNNYFDNEIYHIEWTMVSKQVYNIYICGWFSMHINLINKYLDELVTLLMNIFLSIIMLRFSKETFWDCNIYRYRHIIVDKTQKPLYNMVHYSTVSK